VQGAGGRNTFYRCVSLADVVECDLISRKLRGCFDVQEQSGGFEKNLAYMSREHTYSFRFYPSLPLSAFKEVHS
jgi:hypothetical protein